MSKFNNPTPVVVCLFRVGEGDEQTKLMAVRRNIPPFVGELAFPGGFVDEMESAEQAACREMLEETKIITKPEHWRPLATRITPKNQLLIFMRHIIPWFCENGVACAGFEPNDEVQELWLVDERDTLCFSLHQEVLKMRLLWE